MGVTKGRLERVRNKKTEVPYTVEYTDTYLMVVDIHTKGFTDPNKWTHAQQTGGIMDPRVLEERMLLQATTSA